MGIYDSFQYGDGTLYGNISKSTYSADPFTAVAIGRDVSAEVIGGIEHYIVRPKVALSWSRVTGNILGIRIVRNQEAYSEYEEDGYIIYESFDPAASVTSVYDQYGTEPLVEGKYAYYTVWILRTDGTAWTPASTAWCLVPKAHGVVTPDGRHIKSSARKFVEIFPKVFSTQQQSYLDEVDETSDFFQFFSGFSYSLDETLTYADLLVPNPSGANINPNMIDMQLAQLGMPKEPILSMRRKKALIRNAIDIHKTRGTFVGLGTFLRSLTGFNLDSTQSINALLCPQDSTFYNSTGSWEVTGAGTLTASTDVTPEQNEMLSIDREWAGKLVTTDVNVSLSLGASSDINLRIPVVANSGYAYLFYVKGDTSDIDFAVTWYDITGSVISTTDGTTDTVTSSWNKLSVVDVSPTNAYWASISITFASAGTYYVDMVSLQQVTNDSQLEYHEARGVEMIISPTKINYIENPSFNNTTDMDDTDWVWSGVASGGVDYGASTTAPGIFDGSHMLKLTTDGVNPFSLSTHSGIDVPTDSFYTFSIYASTVSGVENLSLTLSVYDEFDELLTDDFGNPYSNTSVINGGVTSTWGRYQVSVYVPKTFQNVYLKVEVSTGDADSNGNVLCFDAAQLEQGYTATDYFDGTYASQGAYWTGDPNDSVSVLFRNKSVKMDRLIAEISPFLPLNTPWSVVSGVPGAYVLEASDYSS
jgi:hypothetical protein